MKGDGGAVPKVIKVEFELLLYYIQVWCEAPVRTLVEEGGRGNFCPVDKRE